MDNNQQNGVESHLKFYPASEREEGWKGIWNCAI